LAAAFFTDLLLDVVGQLWPIILENEGKHPKKWIPLRKRFPVLASQRGQKNHLHHSWVQLGYMIVTASQRCFLCFFFLMVN
jgi:hypothetical protein